MDLFRKSALQRALSPEQLDQLVHISSPLDWIALLGIVAVILVAIIWSIWGSLTINLPGDGILIKPGGYRIIESPIEGQITKLTQYQTGAIINEGEVIGELAQPVLELQIEFQEQTIKNLQQTKSNNLDLINQLRHAQSQLQLLKNEWNARTKIISPYTGSFLAMRASPGIYIKPGDSILSMEELGKEIIVIIFLPPTTTNIQTIKPGMLTRIFPGLKKDISNGFLLGRVREVSKFPASPQVLNNILNNDYLIKYFSQDGPPYLVYVNLIPDSSTESGYKWSSPAGKKQPIRSGTLCSTLIQVAKEPPINYLIPNIRKVKE